MPEPANYFQPYNPIFNSNGVPVPGAQVFFYTSTSTGGGTSTKAPIYADAELTIELPNPVTANSASRLPAIYLEKDKYYRVVTRAAPLPNGDPGRLIEEIDPFVPGEYPAGPKGDPGAAGNVATDLAALKAFAPSNDAVIFAPDGGTFIWTTADYTGQADDINIVKQDDTPLTTGAWLRQSAASISTKLPTPFSIPVTQQERNERDPVFVSDYVRTSSGDQTLAIERALNDAKILGRPFAIDKNYSCQTVEISSGQIIQQRNPEAVLTILDDGTLQGRQLVCDGVESVSFKGVRIRSNATGRTAVYGNVMIVGGAENIEFIDCDIGYSPSTAIWAGGSSKNILVSNCRIHNNFADGAHFSRGCEDILVENSQFYGNGDDNIAFVGYVNEGSAARPKMRNCRAIGNSIQNNVTLGSGIVFLGVDGGYAGNNRIRNTAQNGITVSVDVTGPIHDTHYCSNIVLEDNDIRDVGSAGIGRCISVDSARNILIRGGYCAGSAEEVLGLFGVIVDLKVEGGTYARNANSNAVLHLMSASSNSRLIQELFTDFGETGVTEALSRNIKFAGKVQSPRNASSIRLRGQDAKLIRGVKFDEAFVEVHPGGANAGIDLTYCDKPKVVDSEFVRFGASGKSSGAAVALAACPKPRVLNCDNDQAAANGVNMTLGVMDFDIQGLRSEGGDIGVYSDDNTANGLIVNSWLRNNATAATINTAGATLADNKV